jgi:hypothetical protein
MVEIKRKKIEDNHREQMRKLADEHQNQHAVCFTVTLPCTMGEFDTAKQEKYKKAVSIAAMVDCARVDVMEKRDGGGSIDVFTSVRCAKK